MGNVGPWLGDDGDSFTFVIPGSSLHLEHSDEMHNVAILNLHDHRVYSNSW